MHPSSIIGPIAAAVVASRLMRSNAERMVWSMGLAASMSGGIRAYAIDGGWSKWLHLGWAAHGGIVAAELAAKGFKGPEFVLNGGSDLYTALLHGEAVDRSSLTVALGRAWKGVDCDFKYYPCAHVIQPFVDAVLSLMKENSLHSGDIAEIGCTLAPWAAAIVCEPREAKLRFSTELEATGSLPYQLACAALDGRVNLASLSPQARARRDIADFSRRVTHRTDVALGTRFEGTLEIVATSGQRFRRAASLPGADGDKIIEKFIALVDGTLTLDRASAVARSIVLGTAGWQDAAALLRETAVDS
jgi:2-methylcitrate dehydratase PrpD